MVQINLCETCSARKGIPDAFLGHRFVGSFIAYGPEEAPLVDSMGFQVIRPHFECVCGIHRERFVREQGGFCPGWPAGSRVAPYLRSLDNQHGRAFDSMNMFDFGCHQLSTVYGCTPAGQEKGAIAQPGAISIASI